jgi:hypothetical protein
VYKLIRNALGDAYRMELVTRNVAMQVKAPPIDRQRRVGLDVAEAERLFEVISGERLEALYVLALTTGLRCGELLALQVGWHRFRISATSRVPGDAAGRWKLQVVEPKTGSSRRTVVLPWLAVRHLKEHKKRQDAEGQALEEVWRKHGLVFASSVGIPVEPRNVNRRWDELRRRAGLDWLWLHDLRHGCSARCALSIRCCSDRSNFGEPLDCELVGPGGVPADGGFPCGPRLLGDVVRVVVENGGVVRQRQVEVGDVDVRLVPVDQRDAIRGHADVARVGVAVDDARRATEESRPRCPASNDTLRRHRAEVDLRPGLGVQKVG